MEQHDSQTLKSAVAGCRTALTQLLERHDKAIRRRLSGSIPKRWRSMLSADDVMQQAYVDAVRGIRRFCGITEDSFACWLETLARRNLLDALKMLEADKRGGRYQRIDAQAQAPDDSRIPLLDSLGRTHTTPSRCAARHEARLALHRAMRALPPAYHRVIEMYDIQGHAIKQVAAALNRSPGAIYMMRARAHRTLREMLGAASKYLSDRA